MFEFEFVFFEMLYFFLRKFFMMKENCVLGNLFKDLNLLLF